MAKDQKTLATKVGRYLAEKRGALDNLRLLSKIGASPLARLLQARAQGPLTETSDVVKAITKAAKVSSYELGKLATLSSLLLGVGIEEEVDSHQAILDDLAQCDLISQTDATRAASVLDQISEETAGLGFIRHDMAGHSTVRKALPSFEGMWLKCVTVSKFEQEPSVEEDLANYSPRLLESFPALSVQIDVDNFGEVQTIHFGLRSEELQVFIHELRVAERQLRAIQKPCPNGPASGGESDGPH